MKIKFLALSLSLLLLGGCAPAPASEAPASGLTVVCAAFPEYSWVRAIVGDAPGIDIQLLIQNGVDTHNYQPSVQDIVAAANCDLLVYNGGPSEAWLADTAAQYRGGKETVCLMDLLRDRLLMEDNGSVLQAERGSADSLEIDEHVWLSLKNAEVCIPALRAALSALDPGGAERCAENAARYQAALEELDRAYQTAVADAETRELVFADRFPFLYLLNDYGVAHTAAFPGCSAESEASFHTLVELTDKLNTLRLPAVLVMEGSNDALAKAVVAGSDDPDRGILVLNSMQSVTKKELASGADYLSIMRENLAVLEEVMGENHVSDNS